MKNILFITFLFIGCASTLKINYSNDSPAIIRKSLSGYLDAVTGTAVGDGASPGAFSVFADTLISLKRDSLYYELLKDTNKVVFVLGLYCLANTDFDKNKIVLEKYYNDSSLVNYCPMGCIIEPVSIGYIVSEILKDPSYLTRQRDNSK